jgi:hypothetical protein
VPDAPPVEAPPAPLVPSVEGVEVTRGGVKVPFRGAAIYTQGTSARYLDLSTEPLTCAAYEPGGRTIAEGEETLSVNFAPLLQPDGSLVWTATKLELRQRSTALEELSGMKLLRPEDAATPMGFSFDQDLVLPASDFFGHEEETLAFRGAGVAAGCGPWFPSSPPPAPQPQPKLTFSVAGRTLPILSAALIGSSSDAKLRLSTHPIPCEGGPSDLLLELELAAPPPGEKRAVYVRGHILASQHNSVVDAADLQIEPAPDAPLRVALQGRFRFSDYKVEIQGEVEAMDCRE